MTTRSCSAGSRSRWSLAEEWEIARFAASLVRVEYKPEPFATDLFAERDKAVKVKKPEKPRGKANKAFAAAFSASSPITSPWTRALAWSTPHHRTARRTSLPA